MSSRKGEPAADVISDVVFEDLRADDVFAVAIVGKSQERSSPFAPIRGLGGAFHER